MCFFMGKKIILRSGKYFTKISKIQTKAKRVVYRDFTPEEKAFEDKWDRIVKNKLKDYMPTYTQSINYDYDTIMSDPDYCFESILLDALNGTYGSGLSDFLKDLTNIDTWADYRNSVKKLKGFAYLGEKEWEQASYRNAIKFLRKEGFNPIIDTLRGIKERGDYLYRFIGSPLKPELFLKEFENEKNRGLGIYWTYNPQGFSRTSIFPFDSSVIMIEAKIQIESIDIYETFMKCFEMIEEFEITLRKGSKVFVKDIVFIENRDLKEIKRINLNKEMVALI